MCHPRRDSSEGTPKNGLVTSFPQPPYGIEHIKYADDVVFTVETDTDIQADWRALDYLVALVRWGNKEGFEFSAEKTTFTKFAKNRANGDPTFFLQGKRLKLQNKAIWLGMETPS